MSATVFPLPPNEAHSTNDAAVDFTIDVLRRLSSMMSGGHNADMLLDAANTIAELSRRALHADRLCLTLQDELTRCKASRKVADDRLAAEVKALKAQLDYAAGQAEHDRLRVADESLRLQNLANEAQAQLSVLMSEHTALQASAAITEQTLLAAQMSLLLARTQFDTLADGCTRNGDVISRTIAEIGGCAIDKALTTSTSASSAPFSHLTKLKLG